MHSITVGLVGSLTALMGMLAGAAIMAEWGWRGVGVCGAALVVGMMPLVGRRGDR